MRRDTDIEEVSVGDWLPEYQLLLVHLSDGRAGHVVERLQQIIAGIAGQQQTQVLIEVSSPGFVHQFVAENSRVVSEPQSDLSPDPGELCLVVGVELLETLADLLGEIAAGPGGEPGGVVEGPRVGVGWRGELGGEPGGYSVILSLSYQDVLPRSFIVSSERRMLSHLVHVKIRVDPLFLQSAHDLSQDINVGLVDLALHRLHPRPHGAQPDGREAPVTKLLLSLGLQQLGVVPDNRRAKVLQSYYYDRFTRGNA